MTDWIEHNGGPQPVDDDVWVQIEEVDYWTGDEIRHCVEGEASSIAFYWLTIERYRILNQHLIDAARKEGIQLGLEAAAQVADHDWPDPNSPIRRLDPDTIAKEAQHD